MDKTKTFIIILFSILCTASIPGQSTPNAQYNSNEQNPFGLLNPDAPEQLSDFVPMIGICDCQSIRRNPDGSWQDTSQMIWSFKYILNGTAIQDEVWDGNRYATSIRQFHPDSLEWIVSYRSYPTISYNVSVWRGKKENDQIVLDLNQKAPNGMDGLSRLIFYNISDTGFDWKGAWVNEEKAIVYPFWYIFCKKRE